MLSRFSCIQLCDFMDCSPPGFFVHVILQTWILEWVTIFFSTLVDKTTDSNLLHINVNFCMLSPEWFLGWNQRIQIACTKLECWCSPSVLLTDMTNQSTTLSPTVQAQTESQGHQKEDPGSHNNQSHWYKIRILFVLPDIEWGHTSVLKGESPIMVIPSISYFREVEGCCIKKTQLGSHTFIGLFSSLPLFCVTGSAFPDSLVVVFVNRALRGKTAFYQGCLSFTVSLSMNLALVRQPLLELWFLTDGSGWEVEVTLPPSHPYSLMRGRGRGE